MLTIRTILVTAPIPWKQKVTFALKSEHTNLQMNSTVQHLQKYVQWSIQNKGYQHVCSTVRLVSPENTETMSDVYTEKLRNTSISYKSASNERPVKIIQTYYNTWGQMIHTQRLCVHQFAQQAPNCLSKYPIWKNKIQWTRIYSELSEDQTLIKFGTRIQKIVIFIIQTYRYLCTTDHSIVSRIILRNNNNNNKKFK